MTGLRLPEMGLNRLGSLGLATALALVAATPGHALDNGPVGSSRCDCMCETANTGYYGTYDSRGYGCAALENRTCNIENPATGLIETGRLWGCGPTRTDAVSAGALLNNLLEQGTWQAPGGNALPASLPRCPACSAADRNGQFGRPIRTAKPAKTRTASLGATLHLGIEAPARAPHGPELGPDHFPR